MKNPAELLAVEMSLLTNYVEHTDNLWKLQSVYGIFEIKIMRSGGIVKHMFLLRKNYDSSYRKDIKRSAKILLILRSCVHFPVLNRILLR